MVPLKYYLILCVIGGVVGCRSCPPLYTEQWSVDRNTGWKVVLPDETAPVYPRLIGALMNEGFVVAITNSIPTGRSRNPNAESNHKVVLFRQGSVSGTFEHYRDSRMDHFTLRAKATNAADAVRCNYYRFKLKMQQLIEGE